MSDDVTRVTKVRATGDRVLRVRFAGDRRDRKVDVTGLIARSAHFAPLMNDAESFTKVEIVEDGLGVAWPIQISRASQRSQSCAYPWDLQLRPVIVRNRPSHGVTLPPVVKWP